MSLIDRLSGNGANAEEKQVALQMADNFIDQMKYPRMKTQVTLKDPALPVTLSELPCQQLVMILNNHCRLLPPAHFL